MANAAPRVVVEAPPSQLPIESREWVTSSSFWVKVVWKETGEVAIDQLELRGNKNKMSWWPTRHFFDTVDLEQQIEHKLQTNARIHIFKPPPSWFRSEPVDEKKLWELPLKWSLLLSEVYCGDCLYISSGIPGSVLQRKQLMRSSITMSISDSFLLTVPFQQLRRLIETHSYYYKHDYNRHSSANNFYDHQTYFWHPETGVLDESW
jgi:hypothetical protein